MVVTTTCKHLYKYPLEVVVNTHLTKYPNKMEKNVISVNVVEFRKEGNGVEYLRRIAVCLNIVPRILRMVSEINVDTIDIEEQCWMDRRRRIFQMQTRNLTWSSRAHLYEESFLKPAPNNSQWTVFEQKGIIDIFGLGRIGGVLEAFAVRFLNGGLQKSLQIMEELLEQRSKAALTQGA